MGKKGKNKLEKRLEKEKIMWRCIKVYKVYGYHLGDLFTDEYMKGHFFYKNEKSLKEVRKIPLGEIYSINYPFAILEFKKVRTRKRRRK